MRKQNVLSTRVLYCVDVEATLARGWSDLWRRINYSRLHSSLKANTNTWLHFPLLRWCACLSWFMRFNADLFICRRVRACARILYAHAYIFALVYVCASVWWTCDSSFVLDGCSHTFFIEQQDVYSDYLHTILLATIIVILHEAPEAAPDPDLSWPDSVHSSRHSTEQDVTHQSLVPHHRACGDLNVGINNSWHCNIPDNIHKRWHDRTREREQAWMYIYSCEYPCKCIETKRSNVLLLFQ